MGVIYEYFAASSDADAAAVLDLDGGPGGALPVSAALRAAIDAGDREAMSRLMLPAVGRSEHGLMVLSVKGIDPGVQMESLEVLLTGVDADVVADNPRFDHSVAEEDDGDTYVASLTDELQRALADRTDGDLDTIAVRWAEEEDGEPEVLAHFLRELAVLARVPGARLYCWVCL